MSDTPETDAAIKAAGGDWSPVLCAVSQRLERERNGARELAAAFHNDQVTLLLERDEAREALKHIGEYGTEEINAGVELRQKLAQALVDLDNMQDQRDLAMKVIKRLELERDEAREDLEFRRGLYKVQEQCLETARRERDEARDHCRELCDLVAYGLGQSGEPWSIDAMRQATAAIQMSKTLGTLPTN